MIASMKNIIRKYPPNHWQNNLGAEVAKKRAASLINDTALHVSKAQHMEVLALGQEVGLLIQRVMRLAERLPVEHVHHALLEAEKQLGAIANHITNARTAY